MAPARQQPTRHLPTLRLTALLLGACATSPKISQPDIDSILNGEQGALLVSLQTTNIQCPTATITLANQDGLLFEATLRRKRGQAFPFQILPLPADTYQISGIQCVNHTEDSQFFYTETNTISDISNIYQNLTVTNGEMLYPGTLSIIKERRASTAKFDISEQSLDLKAAAAEQAPDLIARFTASISQADTSATAEIHRNRQHTLKPQTVQQKN